MNEEYFRPVRTAIIACLIVGAVFLGVQTVSVVKAWNTPSDKTVIPAITVTGEGEAFAVPDIATFTYTVSEEGSSVKVAQDKATTRTNQALAYLKKSGLDEKDIKTISYDAYPEYEYARTVCTQFGCPPGNQVIKGYRVSQTIQVKVRSTDKAGAILSGVGELGVQNVSGLQFTIDDEKAITTEAREKAIADAKAKAEVLARELGVKLVRITQFQENNGGYPYLFKAEMAMDNSISARGGAMPVAPNIPVGENQFRTTVVITYEIR